MRPVRETFETHFEPAPEPVEPVKAVAVAEVTASDEGGVEDAEDGEGGEDGESGEGGLDSDGCNNDPVPTWRRRLMPDIERIASAKHRQTTFGKRKLGLFRKATELSVLCGAEVLVLIFSETKRASIYASAWPHVYQTFRKFSQYKDVLEARAATRPSRPHGCARAVRVSPQPECAPALARAASTPPLSTSAAQVHTTDDYFRERARKGLSVPAQLV